MCLVPYGILSLKERKNTRKTILLLYMAFFKEPNHRTHLFLLISKYYQFFSFVKPLLQISIFVLKFLFLRFHLKHLAQFVFI